MTHLLKITDLIVSSFVWKRPTPTFPSYHSVLKKECSSYIKVLSVDYFQFEWELIIAW